MLQLPKKLPVQEPSSFGKFAVSKDGNILFGGNNGVWLYKHE